jgi:formate hydrogenlyase subunit 6/NADH:ubiquinone oxidoreductase subunit I
MTYFKNIKRGIQTTVTGLRLTLKHLWAARHTKGSLNVQDENYFKFDEGYVTLQYPHETLSVPDNGRYQLDCEIDDCIVCDKCAKICPVNCIEIEAIKSAELIRTTSDGSPVRLHAARFDIDLAKCCFCGLCTTVCPTECLTMNSEYDYSVLDITDLNFAFSNLTPKEAEEKKQLYQLFLAEKELLKAQKAPDTTIRVAQNKVAFKPKLPFQKNAEPNEIQVLASDNQEIAKPVEIPQNKKEEVSEKPKFTPKLKPSQEAAEEVLEKPKFTPKLKPSQEVAEEISEKPKFKPKLKPSQEVTEEVSEKPKFTPKLKPSQEVTEEVLVKPKFTPKLKPSQGVKEEVSETPKFMPKLKPKL